MINQEQLRYIRQSLKKKHKQEQEEKEQTRKKNDAIYNAFASTTYIPPLVDMQEAMKKVREKDYITHEESYSKLTGGYNPMKDMKTK